MVCAYPGIGFGAVSCVAKNFLYWQIPMFLLIFSVLFIVLAKLLNSAMTALPIAVVVTAATAAYFLLFASPGLFISLSDLAIVFGVIVAYAIVARMFYRV